MPNPITQEEAFLALTSLLEKGQVTTQRNLRQELAGRGSGPRLKQCIDAFYAQFGRVMLSSVPQGADERLSLRPEDLGPPVLATATIPADSPWRRLIDLLSAWESDLLRREEILSRREIELRSQGKKYKFSCAPAKPQSR